MKDTHAADWEELARREPYFAVLTNEGFLGVEGNSLATAAFFETGEADIVSLLGAIESTVGRKIHPEHTLDFGCGVGRLTLPLARRSKEVVACDVAPTMLEHVRRNADAARLTNITLMTSDVLASRTDLRFDFACSLMVFQHIPPSIGYTLIRTILKQLVPGGIAALHVTFERPGGRLRRLARTVRGRSRLTHRLVATIRHQDPELPYMQMNEYDESVILGDISAACARLAGRSATQHGDTAGAVLIIEKR